jgi:hypothetical protein
MRFIGKKTLSFRRIFPASVSTRCFQLKAGFLYEGAGVVERARSGAAPYKLKKLLRAPPIKLKRLTLLLPRLTIRRASRVELQDRTFRNDERDRPIAGQTGGMEFWSLDLVLQELSY